MTLLLQLRISYNTGNKNFLYLMKLYWPFSEIVLNGDVVSLYVQTLTV